MKTPKLGLKSQPFPRKRPGISVVPSRGKPFTVRSRLLPSFGVPLEVGDASWMAWYDPPDWELTSVSYMPVTREAEVHGVDGAEIEMIEWDPADAVWKSDYTHYARLTETTIQWLATSHLRKGKRILHTFLDEGFEADWGESSRLLEDAGRLVRGTEGTYTIAGEPSERVHDELGAGMFRVCIGSREFTCLRVIDLRTGLRGANELEGEILSECFYTRSDELVLFRRYNGRLWAIGGKSSYAGLPWDERFPDHVRLVINGAVFVHWHDCLTDKSIGLA